MAVDYDAGRGRRGAYQNLALALQDRLNAQNKREAEDIKRRGLFGSGITQENLNTLASTGMDIAKFGDERRTRQLDRAQDSFDRRIGEMQKRYQFYKDRADKGGSEEDMAVARGLMDQMAKERTRFEDAYGTYSGKSLFETSLGGDAVGYKGADTDATKRQIIEQAIANRQKPQPDAGGQDDALIPASFAGDFSRFRDNPGEMDDEFDDGMMGGVTTPVKKPQFTRYDNADFRLSPRQRARLSRPTEPQAFTNPYSMDTSTAGPQQTGFMDYRDFRPR
jgi:hypothetical protein